MNIKIVDDAIKDDTVIKEYYEITSFGADYDIEGLVKRLKRGDIFIPEFQRNYVWSYKEACEFIESLLLGLPVPGIFLAREPETNKMLVIDGQQRLKSIEFFYDGVFAPKQTDKPRVFKLIKVQQQYVGLTYQTLEEKDKVKFNDYILHATIVKQEEPKDDDTSIYHIFKRLNTGGRKLTPQEIRTAIYHGRFIDKIKEINNYNKWRNIFGPINNRLKDHEFILRFLAMYYEGDNYKKPMNEFLNIFTLNNRFVDNDKLTEYEYKFKSTIDLVYSTFGNKVFKRERAIVAAIFDSVMVGIAKRLDNNINEVDKQQLINAYNTLLKDEKYLDSIEHHTSDDIRVNTRLKIAIKCFTDI